MLTSTRAVLPAAGLFALLGFACGDDSAGPESAVCLGDVPTRLWAPPGEERPQLNGHLQDLFLVGDTAVFRWGRDILDWRMYASDLCGDEVVALDPAPDLVDYFRIATHGELGVIAYGYRRRDRAVVLLDRLEVEGTDTPVELARFADEELEWVASGARSTYFMTTRDRSREFFPAAGLGGMGFSIWRHAGAPDDALERLPGEFVQVVFASGDDSAPSEGPVLTLTEAGELRVYDVQGAEVAAIDQVRYALRSPGGSRVVWQQLGDGVVEPVFVRDLESGVDREVSPNPHTAASWGRLDVKQRELGTWAWAGDDYLGLVGPDHTLIAAHDAATGAALTIPEHTAVLSAWSVGFWLLLPADADETVGALWDPKSDELFTWYRQPAAYPFLRPPQIQGDEWRYLLLDQVGLNRGSYWRIDRGTGEWTELLPTLGVPFVELDDGRLLTALENDNDHYVRLSVVDPDTKRYTPIAANVNSSFVLAPGRGVYYLDSEGADMGLWYAPIPGAEASPRVGRAARPGDGAREFSLRDPTQTDRDDDRYRR